MKKKLLSILTSAVMAAACLGGGFSELTSGLILVNAEEYNGTPYGNYLYYKTVDEDGDGTDDYVSITDCDSSAVEVEIPTEIDGLPVTIINGSEFIGNSAFYNCSSLERITIPDSVTTIGDYAFLCCTSLEGITIPNGVTTIGDAAFSQCTNLASITILNGVTTIGDSAFSQCTSLTSIIIPDSVKVIGTFAFKNCYRIKYVEIPETVTIIGDCAFGYISTFSTDEKIDNFVIYGIENSAAENYALKHGIIFVDVNKPVSLSEKAFTLSPGTSQILSVNNYAGEVEWYSENEDVATVNYGYVRAVSSGTTSICAVAGNTILKCSVKVSGDVVTTAVTTQPAVTTSTTISIPVETDISTEPITTQPQSGTTTVSTSIVTGGITDVPPEYVTTTVPTTTEPVTTTEPAVQGDISGNGKIDLYDAIEICRYIMGMRTFTDEEKVIADFDGNGVVDLYDAIGIAKELLPK